MQFFDSLWDTSFFKHASLNCWLRFVPNMTPEIIKNIKPITRRNTIDAETILINECNHIKIKKKQTEQAYKHNAVANNNGCNHLEKA